MARVTILAVAVVLAAAATLSAKSGLLQLKDGTERFGDINEMDASYSIATETGVVEVRKSDVRAVRYVSAEELFKERRAKLAADDVAGLYDLAVWARSIKLYPQALEALDAVLKAQPTHPNAKLLIQAIKRDMTQPTTRGDDAANGTTKPPEAATTSQLPVLSEDDINVIRIVEMEAGEAVTGRVDRASIDRYYEELIKGREEGFHGDAGKNKFRAMQMREQLKLVLKHVGEDRSKLAADFKITSDPQALVNWRTQIHPWVISKCATSDCHGNTSESMPYRLINTNIRDTNVVYTNFYATRSYVAKDGGRLIDKDRPDESLLLTFALPSKLGTEKLRTHPKVGGADIAAACASRDDRVYKIIHNWISLSRDGGLQRWATYHIVWPPVAKQPAATPK